MGDDSENIIEHDIDLIDPYDDDDAAYDYSSDSSVDIHSTMQYQAMSRAPIIPSQQLQQQQAVSSMQSIEDMTIQQMLDNLDNFQGDEVDAILAKLLPNENVINNDDDSK